MDAGHEVKLFADASTIWTAGKHGVPGAALAGDIRGKAGSGDGLAELMRSGGGIRRMAAAVAEIANENAAAWMASVVADAASSDAVLFSGIASYIGLSVAEHLRIPAVGLGLWPISPTKEFASPLLPPWRMPGPLNLLSHHVVNALLWRRFRRRLNDARREVCGQAQRKQMWRRYPILYGISRHLVARPADWQAQWRICGAWYTAEDGWTPPADLARYLDDGPPPIYVGFGSMAGFDKSRLLREVTSAVAGRRALFYPGWSGIERRELPANFFVVGETAHDWLFPRVAVVIHHGGAGTTHAAARAGVPSIVVPFAGDQFFWAGRLRSAGVAPQYVPHTRITAADLAASIELTERTDVRERARKLGDAMRAERGVDDAVAALESLMGASTRRQPRPHRVPLAVRSGASMPPAEGR